MVKRRQVSVISFTQQLDKEFWLWSDEEKESCFNSDYDVLLNVYMRLKQWLGVDDVSFKISGIVHDKDMSYEWDSGVGEKVIVPKAPHVHVVVELSVKRDLEHLADAVGVRVEQCEYPRGRYGRENFLAYLVHAKDGSKHQYNAKEVETFGTWDYEAYYMSHVEAWNYRKATTRKQKNMVKVDWLVKQVQEGRISKNQIMLTDDYAEIYADNMRLINDAFMFFAERQGFKTLEALQNGEFEMSVYYIQGAPRVGKTSFAQRFIKSLIVRRFNETGETWRAYETGDSNPMDNYNGEEIIFMDDLRASAMTASGWLKFLDPLTSAPVSARYKDKQKASRVIVITSYLDPFTFFSYVKGVGGANEALEQFIGRLSMLAKVMRVDKDRVVSIEGIVQDEEPRHFVIGKGNEMMSSDEIPHMHPTVRNDLKSTRFFNEEIMSVSTDEGIEFLVDDAMHKNDKNKEHKIGDKPKVGAYKNRRALNAFGVDLIEED